MTSTADKPRRLGLIGSIVGLLALVAAVLPHWVVPVMFPPPPTDQIIVDTGRRVKERLAAHVKGIEYQAPRREPSPGDRLSRGLSITAVSLGLLAIAMAVLSIAFREEKLMAGVAVTLGIVALAVEISLFLIGALILVAIIKIVLDHIELF
ncbi:hypothetical protein [Rhodoplanes sp.]|uniref:hypothetical protein n=1 Tax=Rhodoplanes sp. TaxID=1968906 RepID=UPI0025FA36F5|nr:hypothetical protein [Rhodoplanes sp.]